MSERQNDFQLLRDFARRSDQQAFATLVRRHLDLVYATALRKRRTRRQHRRSRKMFSARWLAKRGSLPRTIASRLGSIKLHCSKAAIG